MLPRINQHFLDCTACSCLEAEGKFYPAPAYIAEIGVNQLAEEISSSTTLTPTEVIGVIRSLLLTVPKYMLLGYKVRLDSFGIFKLGLKTAETCKGHEKAGSVTANDIAGVKVMYTPDSMLSAKLAKPEYVKLGAKYIFCRGFIPNLRQFMRIYRVF